MRGQTLRWLSRPENVAILQDTYCDTFAKTAADFRLTIVAGSCYRTLPPAEDVFNTAFVFGSGGELLGTQDQIHLLSTAFGELSAGEQLKPIQTPVGTIGTLLGNDALFPEPARILAYEGAEILVNPAACPGNLQAAKLRHAFEARVTENELYGVQSCLVGKNPWASKEHPESFVGRSAVFGPMELVPRPDGVMMEMGESVEGVLAGLLDLPDLHRWWSDGSTSLRKAMRPGVYHGPLNRFYGAGQTIQGASQARQVQEETVQPAPMPAEQPAIEPASPWAGSLMGLTYEEPVVEPMVLPGEVEGIQEEMVEEPRSAGEWEEPLPKLSPITEELEVTEEVVEEELVDEGETFADSEDEDAVDDSRLRLWD